MILKNSEVLNMRVEAPIKVDRKTKRLAKRLTGGEIAVINHMDIDEVAANSLVEGKIKLVINAAESISGKYPNKGPGILTSIICPSFNSSNNSCPTLSIIKIFLSVNIPGPLFGYFPLIDLAALITNLTFPSTREFAATSSMSI